MKATLDLFGKAIAGKSIGFSEVNKIAVKVGYIVHPDCCTREVKEWLQQRSLDYNATFYQTWNDIISRSRFQLLLDQILHYSTTYGTGFEGTPYVPNSGSIAPDFKSLKVISEITLAEAQERCVEMLYTGVALKQETLDQIFTIVNEKTIDIDRVANKEAKMILCKMLQILPSSSEECVRYMVYLATEKTLLIKDRSTLDALKISSINLSKMFKGLKNLELLAQTFFRFKPIWLVLRNSSANKKFVNKLRKLANVYHRPKTPGFWANILSDTSLLPELESRLSELNNYKKVAILQAILVRQKQSSVEAFVIRNQKLWVQDRTSSENRAHLHLVYEMLYKSLLKDMSAKACKVFIPKGISIKLPTSQKSFIGNYPLGTRFEISDSYFIVGINWKSSEGAQDIDLSLLGIEGTKVGWNASYNTGNFVYSGDMTSADPEATELLYAKEGFKSTGMITLNLYSGQPDSKFKFFIAREKITNMKRNYMVDPNNVLFTIDSEMSSGQKCLGIVTEGNFVLCNLRTGSQAVSRTGGSSQKYSQYVLDTWDCYVDLADTLELAGFEKVETAQEAELDLSNLQIDTLLNLLN